MSWYVALSSPVAKAKAADAINGLSLAEPANNDATAMGRQLAVAKQAALALLGATPGPNIACSLSGHANGTGERIPQGMASDAISVSVTQMP